MNKKKMFTWESELHSILSGIFVLVIIAGIIAGWVTNGFLTAICFGIIASAIATLSIGPAMVLINISENVREINGFMANMDSSVITPTGTALSKAAAEKKQQEDDVATLKNGGWRCKNCGRSNPSYTGTCACGTSKHDQ